MTVHEHHSTCDQCFFFRRTSHTQGDCRRYAPSPYTRSEPGVFALWPPVRAIDWCGDFESLPDPHFDPVPDGAGGA
jgi:hypothetical protein